MWTTCPIRMTTTTSNWLRDTKITLRDISGTIPGHQKSSFSAARDERDIKIALMFGSR